MRNLPHVCQKASRIALTMMLATALSSNAQTPPAEYGIKFNEPPTESLFRREAVKNSVLPINRTYEQLTPEEKKILHGWYENIPAGDEPPFPAEGSKAIHSAIRKGQAILRVTGELYLVATVEPTGEVSAVKSFGSPSPEMTQFAASVLLLTKFKPAICGGQRCRMDFPLYYLFQLE